MTEADKLSDERIAEMRDALEFLTELPLRDDAPPDLVQERKVRLEQLSALTELQELRAAAKEMKDD